MFAVDGGYVCSERLLRLQSWKVMEGTGEGKEEGKKEDGGKRHFWWESWICFLFSFSFSEAEVLSDCGGSGYVINGDFGLANV